MKLRSTLVFTLLYAMVGLVEMAGEMLRESGQTDAMVFAMKPLLMPVLIGWMLANRQLLQERFLKIILISLIFSLGGDVFLMFRNDDFFVFGLASFLIAHILYIAGFADSNKLASQQLHLGGKLIFAMPYVCFVAVFLYILKDHILENPETKSLFAPVVVYASVIGTMGVFASWRVSGTGKASFYMVLGGAILFLLSDSLIAINKFVEPIPYSSLLIMSTYITAQYLIVRGMMIHTTPA